MPGKNAIKYYVANGYYHIYNRGVEKRLIFQDRQDYGVFLSYLKQYLLPVDRDSLLKQLADPKTSAWDRDKIIKQINLNNFSGEVELLAYCLMPNHFHFLIKQNSLETIDKFTRSLCTRYSMYFNRRYRRVGPLYQGVYKAVLVITDEQLLHLTRYIHKQVLNLQGESLEVQPCSYLDYLGKRNTKWIKPQVVLEFFSDRTSMSSYKSFVEDFIDPSFVANLIIEDIEEHF